MFTATLLRMIDKINRAWGVRMWVQPEITLYPPHYVQSCKPSPRVTNPTTLWLKTPNCKCPRYKCNATVRPCLTLIAESITSSTIHRIPQYRREAAIHTYILTCLHTYIHTYLHTCIYTYLLTYLHTYINTYLVA